MYKNILVSLLSVCVLISFSTASYARKKPASKRKSNDSAAATVEKNDTSSQNAKIIRQKPPTEILNPSNKLGLTYAENTIKKAGFYLGEKDYKSAMETLDSIQYWIEDATEFHTELFQTLNRLENSEVQAGIERELAIQFAVLRDKMLLIRAKVDIANKNKQKAVKSLVEVVRSQPSTDIGFEAYEMLQKMGFTYKAEFETVNEPTTPPAK